VTKRIAAAGADERQLRTPCVEQFLTGRGPAAVVRYLQHAHPRRRELRRDRPFDLGAHVAQQQECDLAVRHLDHH